MKKINTSLLVLLLSSLFTLSANKIKERIYVQTDKSFYLAGETIHLQAFSTDTSRRLLDFSKVLYVEVTDCKQAQAQTRLELKEGVATGCMQLPAQTPSGNYQLTAYTRYMQNEGETVYFRTTIGVFNAFAASAYDRIEVVVDSAPLPPSTADAEEGNISISTDSPVYKTRQTVTLTLGGLPEDAHLTATVFRNDSVEVPHHHSIQAWRPEKDADASTDRKAIEAEYEGPIVSGQLVELTTGLPFRPKNKDITACLAIPGDEPRLYIGEVNDSGNVQFRTQSLANVRELVLTAHSKTRDSCRLDLHSPFVSPLANTLPPLRLQQQSQRLLLEHSLAVQTKQLFADSLPLALPADVHFLTPYRTYNLDEYTRFATIRETLKEYVNNIRLDNNANETRLSVLNPQTNQYNAGSTLVLLDGVPLFNHNEIIEHNPYALKMIKIYTNSIVVGGEVYSAVVTFHSHANNLAGFRLGRESQLIGWEGVQNRSSFLLPTPNEPSYPDFRHTLYWNPQIQNGKEGTVTVTFTTSSLPGEYLVRVGGLTDKGDVVFANARFNVVQ